MKLLECEEWRSIPGYEGRYEASTKGRIRSVDRIVYSRNRYTGMPFPRYLKGQILKPGRYCKSGHVSVVLGRKTPGKPVHQLIMRTFVGDPPEGHEVLHRDGNPQNNRLDNLRYGSRRDNILDVYRQGGAWRKLTLEDVEQIRFGLVTKIKGAELAKMYNVSPCVISDIKKGKTYSWL